jgi:hypothetical protein
VMQRIPNAGKTSNMKGTIQLLALNSQERKASHGWMREPTLGIELCCEPAKDLREPRSVVCRGNPEALPRVGLQSKRRTCDQYMYNERCVVVKHGPSKGGREGQQRVEIERERGGR